jgi:hypothetical protein
MGLLYLALYIYKAQTPPLITYSCYVCRSARCECRKAILNLAARNYVPQCSSSSAVPSINDVQRLAKHIAVHRVILNSVLYLVTAGVGK